jgi:alpha-tubulin suppressor-like RCC1 family protein
MSIPRQWVALAGLAMLPACRTPMKVGGHPMKGGDAGAPAAPSDGPNKVDGPKEAAPANLCGDVAQVAVGLLHACALKGDGSLWCWGANGSGELGDGTFDDKAAPLSVTALGSEVVQVTVGSSYTCALRRDATVWCWGKNGSGQLGNGLATDSSTPTPVTALGSTVVEVAAGGLLTCARRLDRTLWCWGFGNFADGTGWNGHLIPTQVTGLGSDVAGIAIGQSHYCARKLDGSLWCWGWNAGGQLGDGSFLDRSTPVEVTALGDGVASVSTGSQATCARMTDGTLWCWGWRNGGATPSQVASLGTDVVAVSGGGAHICARKGNGTLWCWGANSYGQLGDGSARSRDTPVQVMPAMGFLQVAAGFDFTCAVQVDARLRCWGDNSFGQLGSGAPAIQVAPLAIASLGTDVAQLAAGFGSFCARKTDGGAWCWGDNLAGQPDDGPTAYRPAPIEVVALDHSVAQVAGGSGGTTCTVTTDGGVWCWGSISNASGSFAARPLPFQVDGLPTNIVEVAVGWGHACARAGDGTLWCWGRNDNGQVGDGSDAFFRETPVQVSALGAEVAEVATTGTHTCARTIDGTLWCWGSNDAGQLGDGTTTDSATPLPVALLGANVRQVATSPFSTTCARLADGTAWCWGNNYTGQLGDGTTSDSTIPVQVYGLSSVVEITAGVTHSCARTSDGALWCWGENGAGQLGDGMSGRRAMATTPVRVATLGTSVVEVCAGMGATCARGKERDVWCWGARSFGMMGDGDLGFALSPVGPAGCP